MNDSGMGKLKTFSKGDVIRTNPEEGFYGIAVVLSDGKQLEVAPGKMSIDKAFDSFTGVS